MPSRHNRLTIFKHIWPLTRFDRCLRDLSVFDARHSFVPYWYKICGSQTPVLLSGQSPKTTQQQLVKCEPIVSTQPCDL